MEYVLDKGNFDIVGACERSNKAVSIFSANVGYENTIPWRDEIEAVNSDHLYDDLEALKQEILKQEAKKDRATWKKYRGKKDSNVGGES